MTRILIILVIFYANSAFAQLPGFVLTGNPESVNGATWTYQQTINGTVYDLKGIYIRKPLWASFRMKHYGTNTN